MNHKFFTKFYKEEGTKTVRMI